MYHAPNGDRVLLGAERRLFQDSLGAMVDLLSDGDCEFGIQVFDDLQRGQKLFALYRAARALLQPDEPRPTLTAFLEGAVAAVFLHFCDLAVLEIEDRHFAPPGPSWRKRILDAARECVSIDEYPDEDSCDRQEWQLMAECLEGNVLWDADFEAQQRLDVDPDMSRALDRALGIPEDYLPYDPPDDQIDLYVDALKGLTPRGRGEIDGENDEAEPSGDDLF